MYVRMIEKQLKNLEFEYSDNDYFPDRLQNVHTGEDLNHTEGNDYFTEDYEIREEIEEIKRIKTLLEDFFQIRINTSDRSIIRDIYDLFAAERINNVATVITEYIYNNIEELYLEYRDAAKQDQVDRLVDLHDENRKIAVIKNVLQYIVTDCLDANLTEYMYNDIIKFINDNVEIMDDISPYELMVETIRTDDIHHILNICELVKIKLNNILNQDIEINGRVK